MATTTTDIDLLTTVLRLRQEQFPDVPEDLVRSVLKAEQECGENRTEAYRRIQAMLQEQLRKEGFAC